MFISTHLDNNKWKDMQLRKIKTKLYFPMQTKAPLILAGDFNTEPNNPNFYFMLDGGWTESYHAIKTPQVGIGKQNHGISEDMQALREGFALIPRAP